MLLDQDETHHHHHQTPRTTLSPLSSPSSSKQPIGDPMFAALFDNLIALEQALMEIKVHAETVLKNADKFCSSLHASAQCFYGLARTQHTSLCMSASSFLVATSQIASSSITHTSITTTFDSLTEAMHLKVLDPIQVNLQVMNDIKDRVKTLEALRRARRGGGSTGMKSKTTASSLDTDIARLSSNLFDELSALERHRHDFVRGPFESFRVLQHRFFMETATCLETALVPSNIVMPPGEKGVVGTALEAAPNGVTAKNRASIIVALPSGRFDPNADRVKVSSNTSANHDDNNLSVPKSRVEQDEELLDFETV